MRCATLDATDTPSAGEDAISAPSAGAGAVGGGGSSSGSGTGDGAAAVAARRAGRGGTAPAGIGARSRGVGHRLGAALAILVALAAAAWTGHALIELNRHVGQYRTAATTAILERYGEAPVIDSWARLSRVWEAYRPELEPMLEQIRAADEADLDRRLLAWDYVVNRIIEDEGLEIDIGVVLEYYRSVAFCVASGACDQRMTAAFLGDDPWRFRNQHYPYLRTAYPTDEIDADLERIAPRRETG